MGQVHSAATLLVGQSTWIEPPPTLWRQRGRVSNGALWHLQPGIIPAVSRELQWLPDFSLQSLSCLLYRKWSYVEVTSGFSATLEPSRETRYLFHPDVLVCSLCWRQKDLGSKVGKLLWFAGKPKRLSRDSACPTAFTGASSPWSSCSSQRLLWLSQPSPFGGCLLLRNCSLSPY